MSDSFLERLGRDSESRYQEAKCLLSIIGIVDLNKVYSSSDEYCKEKCTNQVTTCLSDCEVWKVKNQILRMRKVLDKVEITKKEIMEQSKKEVEAIPEGRGRMDYGGTHIPGYNISIDNFELTSQLTNGEFAGYYHFKQIRWWNEMRSKGAAQIPCIDCGSAIRKPEQMMLLGNVPHHGKCFKEALKTGKQSITDYSKPYIKRVLQTIFSN